VAGAYRLGKRPNLMRFGRRWGFRVCLLLLTLVARLATADAAGDGKALYLQYCASCHGTQGDGNGPLAPTLTTPPANLRILSQRFGNPLPTDLIAKFIDGRSDVKAHGPRDMPVWGKKFYAESGGDEAEVRELITKLVRFLQSIQTGTRTASIKIETGTEVRIGQLKTP
jgi:Cytochrome C oxidase, cbb3-type, subunit III